MKHLNNNVICAVDIETTGNLPGFDDLVEISVIPLQGFNPDKSIMPFNIWMQPKRPENLKDIKRKFVKERSAQACDPYTAVTMFEHWYEKLQLKHNKRIIPLSFAWPEKMGFLMDWFDSSEEGEPYYYDYFDSLIYRDLLVLANYWNDVAHCRSIHYPFTKQRLHFMAQKMGVAWPRPSTTLSRCFTMIQIYNKLLQLRIKMIDLPFNYPTPVEYFSEDEEYEPDEL